MRAPRATPGGHGIREPLDIREPRGIRELRAERTPGRSGRPEESQLPEETAPRTHDNGRRRRGSSSRKHKGRSGKARGRDTRKARRGQLRPVPTSSHPHLLPGFRGSPRSAGRSARAPGAHAVPPAHRPGHHGAPRFIPPSWPRLAHQPRGRRWREPRPLRLQVRADWTGSCACAVFLAFDWLERWPIKQRASVLGSLFCRIPGSQG